MPTYTDLRVNYMVKTGQIGPLRDSCAPARLRPALTGCVCMCPMLVPTGENTTCILMGSRMLLLRPGTLLKPDLSITYAACFISSPQPHLPEQEMMIKWSESQLFCFTPSRWARSKAGRTN